MNEVYIPTCGRMVHYHLSETEKLTRKGAGSNGAEVLPALVTQVWPKSWGENYTGVNMRVFTDGEDVLWRASVQHKSTANEGDAYWVWPEIK